MEPAEYDEDAVFLYSAMRLVDLWFQGNREQRLEKQSALIAVIDQALARTAHLEQYWITRSN